MKTILASVLAVIAVATGGPAAAQQVERVQPTPGGSVFTAQTNWQTVIEATPDRGVRMGDPQAPIKLVEYSSYSCPTCLQFAREGEDLVQLAYVQAGLANFEIRPYIRNDVDTVAALLTTCGAPGGFFNRHRAMIHAQPEWLPKVSRASDAQRARWAAPDKAGARRAIAADLGFYALMEPFGMNRVEQDRCLADDAAAAALEQATIDASVNHRINSTPSFMVNGTPLLITNSWAQLEPQLQARVNALGQPNGG